MLEFDRARELEPLSMVINANIGFCHIFARQYEQAAKQLRATLEMYPNAAYAHRVLAIAYYSKPTLGDAVAEAQKAYSHEPDHPRYRADLCIYYWVAGKRKEALKIFGDLKELSKRRYVSQADIARILAVMGESKDEIFEALERGYEERDGGMCGLKVIPLFDPLRADPRFQALLRRMNFPE